MAIGTGLASQFGCAEEVTYGTAVTPDHFAPYNDEALEYSRERIESQSMYAGRRTVSDWVEGKRGGAGPVNFDVRPNGGFALLTKHALGQIATTTPDSVNAPTARLHTARVGQLDGKSLTVQIGRPNTAGVVDPYTYAGCKIPSWELSMEAGGLLMAKFDFDLKSEVTSTALATATYPASNVLLPFSNASVAVTIGGTTYNVKKVTVGGNNNQATDRSVLGSAEKLEQLEGQGFREYTGTIDLESYAGLTPYNLFRNGTEAAVVATFSGALIAGALSYMVRVTLARCRFDGENPKVAGQEILDHALPFKALYTSAADTEVKIETQNTDVAP